ncbi:MAG: FtsL-like putative cell division protein [Bacteroidales bacterium]|nr:FtsL-like putative cell division protein [Bacteroidales bacterium]
MTNNSNTEKTSKTVKKKSFFSVLKKLLDGTFLLDKWLSKQLPFIIFLIVLAIIYITTRISAEKKHRQISEIKDKMSEMIAKDSELNKRLSGLSKQTVIANRLRRREIKVSVEPKIIIKDDKGH